MNPCDCKRPESQGSRWRGGSLSLQTESILGVCPNSERANLPGCQHSAQEQTSDGDGPGAPNQPNSAVLREGRVLSSLVSRLSSLVSRLSSVVCRLSSVVCRLSSVVCSVDRWKGGGGSIGVTEIKASLSFFAIGLAWMNEERVGDDRRKGSAGTGRAFHEEAWNVGIADSQGLPGPGLPRGLLLDGEPMHGNICGFHRDSAPVHGCH
jgi:hypothetical protein